MIAPRCYQTVAPPVHKFIKVKCISSLRVHFRELTRVLPKHNPVPILGLPGNRTNKVNTAAFLSLHVSIATYDACCRPIILIRSNGRLALLCISISCA